MAFDVVWVQVAGVRPAALAGAFYDGRAGVEHGCLAVVAEVAVLLAGTGFVYVFEG